MSTTFSPPRPGSGTELASVGTIQGGTMAGIRATVTLSNLVVVLDTLAEEIRNTKEAH